MSKNKEIPTKTVDWLSIYPILISIFALIISLVTLYYQYFKDSESRVFLDIASYSTWTQYKPLEFKATDKFEVTGKATINIVNTGQNPFILRSLDSNFTWNKSKNKTAHTSKSPKCEKIKAIYLRPRESQQIEINCFSIHTGVHAKDSRLHSITFSFQFIDVVSGQKNHIRHLKSVTKLHGGTAGYHGTAGWIRVHDWKIVKDEKTNESWSIN